jgi:hypothetical protein
MAISSADVKDGRHGLGSKGPRDGKAPPSYQASGWVLSAGCDRPLAFPFLGGASLPKDSESREFTDRM